MIAPALKRAPQMLLVIGEDEQGLPTEIIILKPSGSQLYDELRLAGPIYANPLPVSEPILIDVRLRWAGL